MARLGYHDDNQDTDLPRSPIKHSFPVEKARIYIQRLLSCLPQGNTTNEHTGLPLSHLSLIPGEKVLYTSILVMQPCMISCSSS